MTDRQAGEYEREARKLLLELFGPGVDAPPSRIRRFAEMLAQRDQEHARLLAELLRDLRRIGVDSNGLESINVRAESSETLLSELLQAAKDVVRLWQGTSTKIALNRAMADFCTAVEGVEKARKVVGK